MPEAQQWPFGWVYGCCKSEHNSGWAWSTNKMHVVVDIHIFSVKKCRPIVCHLVGGPRFETKKLTYILLNWAALHFGTVLKNQRLHDQALIVFHCWHSFLFSLSLWKNGVESFSSKWKKMWFVSFFAKTEKNKAKNHTLSLERNTDRNRFFFLARDFSARLNPKSTQQNIFSLCFFLRNAAQKPQHKTEIFFRQININTLN